jgi:hypothetical protein
MGKGQLDHSRRFNSPIGLSEIRRTVVASGENREADREI